jgi:DNA-binding CsgD family transcriptional regulator
MNCGEIADLISSIRKPDFSRRLQVALSARIPFDWMSVIFFATGRAPNILHCTDCGEKRDIIFGSYFDGGYLEDPFFIAVNKNSRIGMSNLKSLTVRQGGLTPNYQRILASAEVRDEVCFLTKPHDAAYVMVSLVRSSNQFAHDEVKSLRAIEPIIVSVLDQHFGVNFGVSEGSGWAEPSRRISIVRECFNELGHGSLTDREVEIIHLMLSGYSRLAIASILEIAAGTVKVHKTHIYRKLSISSQGELFAKFYWQLLQHMPQDNQQSQHCLPPVGRGSLGGLAATRT